MSYAQHDSASVLPLKFGSKNGVVLRAPLQIIRTHTSAEARIVVRKTIPDKRAPDSVQQPETRSQPRQHRK